jgi:hypothetical protein
MDNPVNEQGLDEDEQRMGDLWSMTDKENEALAKRFTLIFVLFLGLIAAITLWNYSGNTQPNRPAAPFTWPPPETYDSPSLKRKFRSPFSAQ